MSNGILDKENKDLEYQILQILKQERPEIDFNLSNDLISNGLIDSFEIVMLITEFEKKFSINIPGEDIVPESFATVGAMAKLVRKLKSEV
jgi:acyl carrier protein